MRTENLTGCDLIATFDTVPDEESPFLKYSGLGLTIFSFIWVFACVFFFLWNRKSHPLLYHRDLFFLMLISFGALCYVILVPFRDFYGQSEFLCDAYYLLAFGAFFFYTLPLFLRLMRLYYRVTFNQKLLNLTFDSIQNGKLKFFVNEEDWIDGLNSGDASTVETNDNELTKNIILSLDETLHFEDAPQLNKKKKRKSIFYYIFCWPIGAFTFVFEWFVRGFAAILAPCLYAITCFSQPSDVPKPLRFLYFLASPKYSVMFFLFWFLIFGSLYFGFYFVVFAPFEGCTGCGIDRIYPLLIPIFLVGFIIGVGFARLLWPYPDNLGVKSELSVLFVVNFGVYLFIVPSMNFIFGKVEEEGTGNFSYMTVAVMLFTVYFSMPYQVFRVKKLQKKGQRRANSSIGSTNDSFNDIIGNQEGSKAFALHLASELSLENLYFFKAAQAWKKSFERYPVEINERNAKKLYDLYIDPDGTFAVNISMKMRRDIFENLNEAILKKDAFDKGMREVYSLMTADVFYRFKTSKYFKAYQNNLTLEVDDNL